MAEYGGVPGVLYPVQGALEPGLREPPPLAPAQLVPLAQLGPGGARTRRCSPRRTWWSAWPRFPTRFRVASACDRQLLALAAAKVVAQTQQEIVELMASPPERFAAR